MLEVALFAAGLLAAAIHGHLQLRAARQAHALERAEWRAESAQWTRERQLLLNRVKPETAQFVMPDEPVHNPSPVQWDDDEDYWRATADMSTDELARALMDQEMAERDGVVG